MFPTTQRRVFAVFGVFLLLVASGCTAVDPRTEPAPTSTAPAATAQPSASESATVAPSADPIAERTISTLDLGGGPDLPTEAFGSLWVLAVDGPLMNDGTTPALHRIDPEANEVIASVELPGRLCQGIGFSPDAIWACGPDGLIRIDPNSNEVVATVELPAALVVSRIPYGADSVWAFATSTVGPDRVVRVDPSTNTISATIDLGGIAGTMAFGLDALWVTMPSDGALLRIDPATNEIEEWTTGLDRPGSIAVGADALWVSLLFEHGSQADDSQATMVRIDPQTGDVASMLMTGGSLADEGEIAVSDDAVWVRAPDPWLVRIDPQTNEVVARLDTRSGPGAVTVAFGSVWVTTERGEVIRLEP